MTENVAPVVPRTRIHEGDVLEPVQIPVTRETLVRYAGASTDFNPIHWSDRAARAAGMDGVSTSLPPSPRDIAREPVRRRLRKVTSVAPPFGHRPRRSARATITRSACAQSLSVSSMESVNASRMPDAVASWQAGGSHGIGPSASGGP